MTSTACVSVSSELQVARGLPACSRITSGGSARVQRLSSSLRTVASLSSNAPRVSLSSNTPRVHGARFLSLERRDAVVACRATAAQDSSVKVAEGPTEKVFFDGGTHYGDFLVNFALGLTGIWLPVMLTSLFRTLYLRYRFTDRRFTILSGLADSDRRDYPYSVVSEVRSLPRFIGEWGDIAITLKDKTVVELKAVPKFREIAKYVEEQAKASKPEAGSPSSSSSAKGF